MGEERRQCKSEEENAKAIPACPIVKTYIRAEHMFWRCINTPHGGTGTAI